MKHCLGLYVLELAALVVAVTPFGQRAIPASVPRGSLGGIAPLRSTSRCTDPKTRAMATASSGQMLFQMSQQAQAALHDQEQWQEFLDSEALIIPTSDAMPEGSAQPPSFLELEEQMAPDMVEPSPGSGAAVAATPATAAVNTNITLGATVTLAAHAASAAAKGVDEAYIEQVTVMHSTLKEFPSSAFIAAAAVLLAIAMLCNNGKSEGAVGRRGWWWRCTYHGQLRDEMPGEIEAAKLPMLSSKCHESFSMPLIHAPQASSEVVTFQIHRSLSGSPLQTQMCGSPDGCSWSKIEISAGLPSSTDSNEAAPSLEAHSPLVVCRLMQNAADAESQNIQGALASWLSLLLDEKTNHLADGKVEMHEPKAPIFSQGTGEELMQHQGQLAVREPALEMYDGSGMLLGSLRPTAVNSATCYSLVSPHGHAVVEIEVDFNAGWIALSKGGQVVALGRFKGGHRAAAHDLELHKPGSLSKDHDVLQVDMVSGTALEDAALLLVCTFGVLVLEPKVETLNVTGPDADVRQLEQEGATRSQIE